MIGRYFAAFGLAFTLVSGPALGQSSDDGANRVASKTDWSVFIDEDPKICWSVSQPKDTAATRDGRAVSVRRGDILLFVSFRPGDSVKGEIAYTGGYPFASGSTVSVSVEGTTFEFYTEGEWAWPNTPEDDQKIADAMKRGTDAVVVGRSSRGTQTKDTFSLLGFTAALEEAQGRCSG